MRIHDARAAGAADDARRLQDLGARWGTLRARGDHLACFELDLARAVSEPNDPARCFDEIAGIDGREKLDGLVRGEQPLVAVAADQELRGDVSEQAEHARAVDEVAAV